MKDIRVKPSRQAYICPGCHRRINIDTETIQMRAWSFSLCNHEISCGEELSKPSGVTSKASIEAVPMIYCNDCERYYDPIDWDIADLVHLMQELGINTVGSCSGHGGELCYDGIEDVKKMMENNGHYGMLVSAYVTYKMEDTAFYTMSRIIDDFASKEHCECLNTVKTVYKHDIILDDGSHCSIYFYNHESPRYGGCEKVLDDYNIVKETIPYAEVSFTYECNDITSITEKSAQKQMVELISKFCEFIRSNFGDCNNRKEPDTNA